MCRHLTAVDSRRLAVLLGQFNISPHIGNSKAAHQQELRTAYLRKASKSHPDAGGREDGKDFIQLQQDYDEAQALLKRSFQSTVAVRHHPCNYSAPWGPPRGGPVAWQSRAGGGPEDLLYNSGGSPGAPPARLVCFVGASLFLGFAWSMRPREVSEPSQRPTVATEVRLQTPTNPAAEIAAEIVRPQSDYYNKRVKKSEPSNMFVKRPHSKVRGSVYISPLHAAAEDGKAEWLHWVGERSRVCVVSSLDRKQQTPLHYAARSGQEEACAVLLKFQANPRERCKEGKTPLDLAREAGHVEVAQMLERGAPGPLANVQHRQPGSLRSQNIGIQG